MLAGLDHIERKALYLHIHFANTNTSEHANWDNPWLDVADAVGTYTNVRAEDMAIIEKEEKEADYQRKGLLYGCPFQRLSHFS